MIRLHLISLISPLPPYGFQSNLVPTERSFRGEPNAIGCYKKFGEEPVGDIRNYQEMSQLAQIRNISAFLFQLVTHWTSPPMHQVFSLNSESFLAGFGGIWRLERGVC